MPRSLRVLATCAAFGLIVAASPLAKAQTFTTLYRFCSQSDCSDGEAPDAGLIQASDGNFYGTTSEGGASHGGTAFKMTPSGTLTTLYSFCAQTGCPDGWDIWAGVVQGSDGNFYGTTLEGGANNEGTVYKITPSGALTTLYSFCAQSECTDGLHPEAGLLQGSDGNFYGTTDGGGASNEGTVFKITPSGARTTLYSFCGQSGCPDGDGPAGVLIQASDGNFYGTTYYGGANGGGTAFKLTAAGALTTLYSFCAQLSCSDGEYPYAGLVQGSDGNFYGTNLGSGFENNQGTVFKLVVATTAPAVTFSPNPLAFGSITENSSSTLDLTITNSGTASLDISNFSISAGSPTFAMVSGGTCNLNGQTLTAGVSCTVAINFLPNTTGPFNGTFTLTDNAGGSPQSVSLTGTGIVAIAAAFPSSLDFGNVSTQNTSAPQAVTLSNTGTAALNISSIATSANFGQTNNCNGSVAAGTSCTINVTFAPTATGLFNGMLTITDNSNGVVDSTQTVSLSGSGIVPVVNWPGPIVVLPPPSVPFPGSPTEPVSPRSGGGSPIAVGPGRPILSPLTPVSAQSGTTVIAPAAGFSSSFLIFAPQAVSTSSSAQMVTLSNPGDAPVQIFSISASGDFQRTNDWGSSLEAGANCTISVTFKPVAEGTSTGTLSISEESAGSPQQSVALRGTGSTAAKPHQGALPAPSPAGPPPAN